METIADQRRSAMANSIPPAPVPPVPDDERGRAVRIVMMMPLGGLAVVMLLAIVTNAVYWLWLT